MKLRARNARFLGFCDGEHALRKNTWTHVAVTMSHTPGGTGGWKTSWTLYLDGEQRSVVSVPQLVTVRYGELSVGQSPLEHFLEPFEGAIDEVRLWNRARSPSEIKWQYKRRALVDKSLIGHWNFDVDASGHTLSEKQLRRAVSNFSTELQSTLSADLADLGMLVPDLSGLGHTGLLEYGMTGPKSRQQVLFGGTRHFAPKRIHFAPSSLEEYTFR